MQNLGVEPDELGLEKLDKVTAGFLIGAAVDRGKPRAPADQQRRLVRPVAFGR